MRIPEFCSYRLYTEGVYSLKTEVVQCRVSPEHKAYISEVAEKSGITVADVVKQALDALRLGAIITPDEDDICKKLDSELRTLFDDDEPEVYELELRAG